MIYIDQDFEQKLMPESQGLSIWVVSQDITGEFFGAYPSLSRALAYIKDWMKDIEHDDNLVFNAVNCWQYHNFLIERTVLRF